MSSGPYPAAARRLAPAALAAALACSTAPATRAPVASAAPPAPAAGWPGTYDVVGTGFPEGEREAVLTVARRDTGYAVVSLDGPSGRLRSARFVGDSAHVVWDLGAGGRTMTMQMRSARDSLTGVWAIGAQQGRIHGRRRP
jgi:hypothetical protein